jgi:PPP family 3-phenylpropionic acid transporter
VTQPVNPPPPAPDARSPAPASFQRFAALWFCYFAAIGAFNPWAPLWFKEIGFSALAIGGIASLQAWTRVLAPYGWGWLGDHGRGRVRLIRGAALGSVIFALALLWVRGHAAVAVAVFLLYMANGGVIPLSEAALARHLNDSGGMDSRRYARVRVWGSIGFISAVLLIGVVLQAAGIGWFPALVVGMFGSLWLAARRLPEGDARGSEAQAHGETSPVLAVLAQPVVAWFFASIFWTVLAHTALYAFFALYLDQLGYDKAAIGVIWAIGVVAEIAFFRFQGRWFERLNPAQWLQLASVVAALRFALIAAAGSWWPVLVVASLAHALSFGAQHVAIIVFINERFGGRLRGRGQALYTVIGYGFSGVVGGIAGGWLITGLGYAAVFWAAAAAALLGWFAAWRSSRLLARQQPASSRADS